MTSSEDVRQFLDDLDVDDESAAELLLRARQVIASADWSLIPKPSSWYYAMTGMNRAVKVADARISRRQSD